jgi:hypothetical protein
MVALLIALASLFLIILVVSMWVIFERAGEPGWAALVPVYNGMVLCRICGYSEVFVILGFIPIGNLIFAICISVALAEAFRRSGWFALGLLLLPFVFYPLLAFTSPPGSYAGKKKTEDVERSVFRPSHSALAARAKKREVALVNCTHCQTACNPETAMFGHVAVCAACSQRFIESPRPNLTIHGSVLCSYCGAESPAATAVVASILTCSSCGGQFAGPRSLPVGPATPAGSKVELNVLPGYGVIMAQTVGPKRKKPMNPAIGYLIAAGITYLVFIIGNLIWHTYTGIVLIPGFETRFFAAP